MMVVMATLHNATVTFLGDSVDGSILLEDHPVELRSYSDNELLSSTRRRSVLQPSNPSTQPSSETTSLTGEPLCNLCCILYH